MHTRIASVALAVIALLGACSKQDLVENEKTFYHPYYPGRVVAVVEKFEEDQQSPETRENIRLNVQRIKVGLKQQGWVHFEPDGLGLMDSNTNGCTIVVRPAKADLRCNNADASLSQAESEVPSKSDGTIDAKDVEQSLGSLMLSTLSSTNG